jgi:hypothetical protein
MMKYLSRLALLTSVLFTLIVVMTLPSSAHVATAGPTAPAWYFAEGRVGGGFVQWITVGNPNTSDCTVNVQYDYTLDGTSTNLVKTVSFLVSHLTRHTQYVNADLNVKQFANNAATLSAIVSTSDCPGIVVERPMYFSGFHSTSSGTDVLGTTSPQKTWYAAEVPSGSAGETFLTVLNPGTVNASVSVTYYVGGIAPITVTQTVGANARGTFQPNGISQLLTHQHSAAMITSDQPIVVERASYFPGVNGVSGSADVMGIAAPANSWVLAAGTVRSGALENIIVASDPAATAATPFTITLISATGVVAVFDESVSVHGQVFFNVNSNNTFAGHTDDVSADVSTVAPDAKILVQREIFEQYSGSNPNTPVWTAEGVSDSPGVPMSTTVGPQVYSFAEGFTSANFNEWLMLTNPTTTDESVTVQLTNMLSQQSTNTVPVNAHSRVTFDVTSMVQNSASVFTLSKADAYAVSAMVSSNGAFAVERVEYWNAFSSQGVTAVPGLTGGGA